MFDAFHYRFMEIKMEREGRRKKGFERSVWKGSY